MSGRFTVFVQVGRYIEFRGPTLAGAVAHLRLRRIVLPRGGYRFAAGFPVALLARFLSRALGAEMIVGMVGPNNLQTICAPG